MSKRDADQSGFTLVELLMVISIVAILMTLAAFSIRHFWFVRSLQSAQDGLVTQLRRQQQQSVAESHPRIYGVRFPGAGGSTYGLLRVQLGSGGGADSCVQYETRTFDGVEIFSPGNSSHTNFPDSPEATLCRTQVPGANASDEMVFFYARGTATAGQVKVRHPLLDRRKLVCVYGLTGRVESQDGNTC